MINRIGHATLQKFTPMILQISYFRRLMAVHLERPDDFLPQDAWDIIQNP